MKKRGFFFKKERRGRFEKGDFEKEEREDFEKEGRGGGGGFEKEGGEGGGVKKREGFFEKEGAYFDKEERERFF